MTADSDTASANLLRTTARDVFAELFPPERVRESMATPQGWDRQTWHRLTGELGVAGLMVDESLGGSGLTARELGLVFEEGGRCLGGEPMFSVAGLAIPLLLQTGDRTAHERWLPGLCDGTLTATVIYADGDGRWGPSEVDIGVESDQLFGRGGYVVDAAESDLILTPARTPEGPAVFAVERHAAGVELTPLITLDQTRKQAHVELRGARGIRLTGSDDAAAVERAYAISCALLASELCGVASRCLEMTVDYARQRLQFGRPIGSFQAVKQKLADLLIRVESARSAATAAVTTAATDSPDLWWTASLAKAYCAETAMYAAEQTIQIHGGIGFTWEHDAHLYFKRARAGEELLGTARTHYDRVGEHLGQI